MSSTILACCLALTTLRAVSVPLSKEWQVVVRPFQPQSANQGLFWVGLRNEAAVPRAFCLLGVRFSYELSDGSLLEQPSKEYPSGGSVGPCAPSLGNLVLPGETHFVKVQVVQPRNAVRGTLAFTVTAEETCVQEGPCVHALILTRDSSP